MNKCLPALIFFSNLILLGCSDFFETDISHREVKLFAPGDNVHTTVSTQTFWWSMVDGADRYRLSIVSPGFENIERLIVDTNLTGDKFSIALNPGEYEWSVFAFNYGYRTPGTFFKLFIDSTSDLTNQQLILVSPSENFASREKTHKLKWQKIYSALSYQVEIRKGFWDNGEQVGNLIETSEDTASVYFEEGQFSWGVKAVNSGSGTPFRVRTIIVDLTSPDRPVLNRPQSGNTLKNSNVKLEWSRPNISGSSLTDSVYVSSDSLHFYKHVIESYRTSNTSIEISLKNSGDYFWRVRSIDAVGNKSIPSFIRKFKLELL